MASLTPSAVVIDTNIVIDQLQLISELTDLAQQYHHVIVIPNEVTRELDGLKVGRQAVAEKARAATKWLYVNMARNNGSLRGQKLSEVIDTTLRKDDAILDCCLYFQQKRITVVLFSNDRNLCVKALTNSVPTVTFQPGLGAREIASMIAKEAGLYSDIDVEMECSDDFIDFQEPDENMDYEHAEREPTFTSSMDIPLRSIREEESSLSSQKKLQSMQVSPVESKLELPAPKDLITTQFDTIGFLERTLYTTVMENAKALTIHAMKSIWNEDEYAYFVKTEPEATPQALASLYKAFSIALFGDYFTKPVRDAMEYRRYPQKYSGKESLGKFIEFWTTICLMLSKSDPQYRTVMYHITEAYAAFFAPPERP